MTLQKFIAPSSNHDLAAKFLENLTANNSKQSISFTGKQGSGMQPLTFPFWNQMSGYYPSTLIEFLMKGWQTTVISGTQGSGKTTLMMNLISEIHPKYSILTNQKKCDFIRSLYPERNVLPFKKSDSLISDFHPRRDVMVSVFDYEDLSSSREFLTVHLEGVFSLFTYYGNELTDIIASLSSTLMKSGICDNKAHAERLAANLIDFNIHIERDQDTGARYIKRITECVPLQLSFNGQQFETRNIVEWRDGKYVTVQPISPERLQLIEKRLSEVDNLQKKANGNAAILGEMATVPDTASEVYGSLAQLAESFRAFTKLHWMDEH
ncbi:hypothetical protein [Lysinibacillus sp. OL1]|uniref:hypothetical protein n=1 Tax=Lysinibacillus sp. OL1 TaxID=2517243 RepID=UPI001040387C|nr:hypothetical protein [Lysinibacillus sp. OL1]TBV85463.1 hypothetical protein EW028_21160 [Lysinibacillus sp. OL1]